MSKDWITVPLGKVITLQRGFDLPNRLRKAGDVPIVTSSGTGDTHNEAIVKGPGVVTGRYGTIGEVFYIERDFWPLNTTLFVRDFHGNDPLFISYLLRTIDFQTHSGKSGVPGVNRNDLHEEVISLPSSLAEQKAIAEALSDVDGLISALDALIAKKRALKGGAMQELLTGQRRLPGFAGDWAVKMLGEIGYKFLNGGTPSTQKDEYWQGEIPWITGADVVNQKITDVRRFITEEAVQNSATNVVEKGNLLIVTRTGVGKLAIAPFDLAISQDLTGVYVKSDLAIPEYLYRFFDYNADQLKNLNQGTSIAGITRETLTAMKVSLPPLAEQTAIAQILADMDAELAALAQKRAKTVALKQGMMGALLTGQVRLG